MELPNDVEEILSDDYEEGEILEDDNLYEDVSSLEEFSCGEVDLEAKIETINDLTKSEPNENMSKSHRKKEHKCKDDSVCRKERKGKHCYARIRKEKLPSSIRPNVTELPEVSINEKTIYKKDEVTTTGKRNNEKVRLFSPPSRLRKDYSSKSRRHDYKDYHEKENRMLNKRHWKSNEKFSKSKFKHFEKPRSRTRDYKPKYTGNSLVVSAYRNHIASNIGSDAVSTKTSLLQRLVGSCSGFKTLKENEAGLTSEVQTGNSDGDVTSSSVEMKSPQASNIDQLEESSNLTEPNKADETEDGGLVEDNPTSEIIKEQKEESTEPKKKIFGLVWKRSMKDDTDELHLRVEALKSAWVKKLSDRKKKGLITQRKSNGADDSLADLVLESDSDEFESSADKVVSSVNFSCTDSSGDILKPVDMEIVAPGDSNTEDQIICEPALQIGAPSTNNDSSVFIPSNFICLPNSEDRTSSGQVLVEATNVHDISTSNNNINMTNRLQKKIPGPKGTPIARKCKSPLSRGSCRKEKRRKMRKGRKSRRRESLSKSLSTPNELDEENILREKALMSLRNKAKPFNISSEGLKEESNTLISPKMQVIPMSKPTSDIVPTTDLNLIPLHSADGKLKDKATLFESEVTGALSSSNFEEDIDVDILRAQLLTSLAKQVTEIVEVNNASPVVERVIQERLDKKRIKNISKKVWKNVSLQSENKSFNTENKLASNMKSYGKLCKAKENRAIVGNTSAAKLPTMPPIPQVPKMIITVDDSDSSSDEIELEADKEEKHDSCIVPPDFEANIELLLEEAKQKSLPEKLATNSVDCQPELSVTDVKSAVHFEENKVEKNDSKPSAHSTASVTSSSNGTTPQALRHLPAWQQEEYRRLKMKIAERERVLEVVRGKIPENELCQSKLDENVELISLSHVVSLPEGNSVNTALERELPAAGFDVPTTGIEKSSNNESNKISCTGNCKASCPQEKERVIAHEGHHSPHSEKKQHNYSSDENTNPEKKTFPNIASCSVMEEISVMNDIVTEFEKNFVEYSELKKKWTRLRKALKWTESKMTEGKKKLLDIKDNIQKKERMISSKIDSLRITQLPTGVKNKPVSRDMELIKLKYKEVSLRAQFQFHNFSSQLAKLDEKGSLQAKESVKLGGAGLKRPVKRGLTPNTMVPVPKKALCSSPGTEKGKDIVDLSAKRTFSGKERERGDWDPNTPVCHYDLHGICKDEECKYQHFKTV